MALHRSEQVVDAALSAIAAQTDLQAFTDKNRDLSLSDEDQELPAIIVTGGVDSALSDTGATNLSFYDSLLELRVICFAKASSEQELKIELVRLRSVAHRALLGTDRTQGLSFVIDTRYGGANAPVKDPTLERIAGAMECHFYVHYRMNLADPD